MLRLVTLRVLMILTCAYAARAGLAVAAPTLSVSNTGANLSGNLEWVVEVAPDAALFSATDLGLGGSVAVELAFEVLGSDLLSVVPNNAVWPVNTFGENPFTRTATSGVVTDLGTDTVFASLLSVFLTANTAVEVFTIETSGVDCTTLVWGGHTVLPGTADEYESSLIAQGGQNFTGYQGLASEPTGDFDADCDVDGTDFLEWQQSFGSPYNAIDLIDWQANYGTLGPLQASIAVVPEPAALALLALGLLISNARRLRN